MVNRTNRVSTLEIRGTYTRSQFHMTTHMCKQAEEAVTVLA